MRATSAFVLALAAPVALATTQGCELAIGLDHFYIEEGGAGGNGGTGGTGGTTTTVDPGCIPSQSPDPVRDDCGVFVSSSTGHDGGENDGSKGKPFATIAKALASEKAGPIYLCAETFGEAVQIKAGVTIYGGLDCASGDWKWIGSTTKSEIRPEAGKVPLVVDPLVEATIEDVALRAKDAVEAGGSSIAVIATSGAELKLTRVDVEAGNAKDGATGEAFAMSAALGAMGNPGMDACAGPANLGGLSVTNACDDADPNDNSISGSGGIGQEAIGSDGSKGSPGATDNRGLGEDAMACTNGGPGDTGAAGMPATGAQGQGTISAQGYAGVAGNPGEKGKPGQGGGGGGGAKGGAGAMKCADPANAGGASGGSGGSGGCGGLGGKGGGAGGASIGVVSLGATLTLADVKITTKNGGKGGNGGDGQLGGMGGPGGMGGSKGGASMLKDGCSGGPGGAGGPGGKGGGGTGGHSIGIAYTGEAPDIEGATITTGTAGLGGAGEGEAGKGAAGEAAATLKF